MSFMMIRDGLLFQVRYFRLHWSVQLDLSKTGRKRLHGRWKSSSGMIAEKDSKFNPGDQCRQNNLFVDFPAKQVIIFKV